MGLYVTAIVLMGNRYGWTEAVRLKMFVEPSGFVFLFVQFVLLLRYLYAKFSPTKSREKERIGKAEVG